MPTYEYRCARCNDTFDVFQKFSARSLRTHEGCGGELSKVIHPAGVVFKGPGFYTTDSRSNGGATTATASSGTDSSSVDD